jgi:hypothetical protein
MGNCEAWEREKYSWVATSTVVHPASKLAQKQDGDGGEDEDGNVT